MTILRVSVNTSVILAIQKKLQVNRFQAEVWDIIFWDTEDAPVMFVFTHRLPLLIPFYSSSRQTLHKRFVPTVQSLFFRQLWRQ